MAVHNAPGAGIEDAVVRRECFEADHPEVRITQEHGLWYAYSGNRKVAGPCYWLGRLLDALEAREAAAERH